MPTDNLPFELLDPHAETEPEDRRRSLAARAIPASLGDHRLSARYFVPDDDLVVAVNTALTVGAPLLLTGEPGTGKTQVAFYLARHFGIEDSLFPLYVQSTTTAADLIYRFDTVGYFHAANDPARQGAIAKSEFVTAGPLWRAYETGGPAVVLLDEIDKAPRDFPNDLLNVLDQHRFFVRESERWVERKEGTPPPVVVITSNSERRLPEPFLRRCIFHHLELTRDLMARAVTARAGDFPKVSGDALRSAIDRFEELRTLGLRKKPATAELLVWLAVLSAQGGIDAKELRSRPLKELPALGALIKDRDDLKAL